MSLTLTLWCRVVLTLLCCFVKVTKRVDSNEKHWSGWNWRTEGDVMVNGAFFVPSGDGVSPAYARATSVQPKAAAIIDQLTVNAGVFGDPRYYYQIIYSIASSTQTSIYFITFIFASILLFDSFNYF